jgi:hypothetical protein
LKSIIIGQSFDFYASHADYLAGKTELTDSDLLGAFDCILRDAESGQESFNEFCGEFGYDNDSIKALRIWEACKETREKLVRIFPAPISIAKIASELNELIEGVEN